MCVILLCIFVVTGLAFYVRRIRNSPNWDGGYSFISPILNGLTGGCFRENFCARAGRKSILGDRPRFFWSAATFFCDWLFDTREPDHCFKSFIRHKKKAPS